MLERTTIIMNTQPYFIEATPIWVAGRETERNLRMQFKALCPACKHAQLHLITSGIYQLWVNGQFVSYGPARAGKNHFRMEKISLSGLLNRPNNRIIIEVNGYNTDSFYIQNQSSFLQAEILSGEDVLCWTGKHFSARVNPFYIQKMQRYSRQRPMVESYRITTDKDCFFTDDSVGTLPIATTEEHIVLERFAPYPQYEKLQAEPIFRGDITPCLPEYYRRNRSLTKVGTIFLGFPMEELEWIVTDEGQRMSFTPNTHPVSSELATKEYQVYMLSHNATGMVTFTASCTQPVTLYLMFDEILTDGKIDFLRGDCANIIRYDLCPGTHHIHSFEVYTMKFLQLAVQGGACTITNLGMTEYKAPPVRRFTLKNDALQLIADAAVETYRQNAVDLFTDCPSRERAGWLCDSYFTAKVEYCLTKQSIIEKSFLENFLHESPFADIPKGAFPMCYPSDNYDGLFIPNWNLWLILQLKEYLERSDDKDLIERFHEPVIKMFDYFATYENENGLLENLPSWIFIEWSKANDLVKDVSYASNMLYALALKTAGELYKIAEYIEKAKTITETIRRLSYNGNFFTDNAVREDGILTNTGETSETCQYYAFFTGVATPELYPKLFQTLIAEFGPYRDADNVYPTVYPSAPFIGNYLRLDILTRHGYKEQVLNEIEGFFLSMAEATGTLWEHQAPAASCNHGFASYVLYLLEQAID